MAKTKSRKAKRVEFIVSVEIPDGVTLTEMKAMIADAVACWPKSMDPECPMFDLDGRSVKIRNKKGE